MHFTYFLMVRSSNFYFPYIENYDFLSKKFAHVCAPPPYIFRKREGLVEPCEHFRELAYVFRGGSIFAL